MTRDMLCFLSAIVMMLGVAAYDTAAIMFMFKPRISRKTAAMLLFSSCVLLFFPVAFDAGEPDKYLNASMVFGIIQTLANFYFLWLCFEGHFWEKVIWITLRDMLDPIYFTAAVFTHFYPAINFTDAIAYTPYEFWMILLMQLFALVLRGLMVMLLSYAHRKVKVSRELERTIGILNLLAYSGAIIFLMQRLHNREISNHGDTVLPVIIYSVCIAVVCKIVFDTLENHRLTQEINKLAEQKQAQYDLFMARLAADEETRRLRHDIKGHVAVLLALLRDGEYERAEKYLEELNRLQASFPSEPPRMENAVAGALIADKYLLCQKENISFSVDGGVGKNIGIPDVDLVCLLSNLLDNAIEACLQVEVGKRRISLKFAQRAGCLFIREENTKRPKKVLQNGELIGTTKADRSAHGFGARIMRDVVKRCDGTMEFQETEDTFTAVIMLRPETDVPHEQADTSEQEKHLAAE
jgi:sensor histidine kinase YesM